MEKETAKTAKTAKQAHRRQQPKRRKCGRSFRQGTTLRPRQ